MAKKQTEGQVTRKGDKPTATQKSKAVAPKGTKPPSSRQQPPPGHLRSESDEPAQHYIVRGVVSYPNNAPAAGLTVIAFDKDVAGEDRLGEVATDAKGSYQIRYSADQFRRSKNESRGADVFVRIYGAKNALLFQSKTLRNAPADLRLDVKLPASQLVVRGRVTGVTVAQAARDLGVHGTVLRRWVQECTAD